jgi:hypothetical protein
MKLAVVIFLLLGASFASAQSRRSSDLPEEYNVIVDRNMFLRERQRPREPSTQPATTQRTETPPDVPERRFVLRGIVIEDGALRAYIENTRGGVTRVSPGDAIATGHITEIAIDAVAYAWPDGDVKWVEIGQNLEGVRQSAPAPTASPPSSEPTTAGNGTSAAPAPEGTPNTANLSLEERMRLRRQQGR